MTLSLRLAGLAALTFGLGAPSSAQTLTVQPSGGINSVAGGNAAPLAPAPANPAPANPAPASLADTMRGRALTDQVAAYSRVETDDAEQDCLANAVYFEARGESLEGQLAVAEVVMNRAASGRYPSTLCGVVLQPAQFSFVRNRRIPAANRASEPWRRAVAIARIAQDRVADQLSDDVLWYHADYVSPGWGRRLNRTTKIGAHIFYR